MLHTQFDDLLVYAVQACLFLLAIAVPGPRSLLCHRASLADFRSWVKLALITSRSMDIFNCLTTWDRLPYACELTPNLYYFLQTLYYYFINLGVLPLVTHV
ncbi:uncharacterized protein F4807DRAFT_181220 [Annulohypoxylon truncatum]|uniref:uncharacterized protein n=1 Tax=Annulohypoxylon truncatum TaxID=327061 RepID=UPI002007245B|nr:uncharacterized protein F4807DRAFT_181220 [Annulohypoxylon truncatum]KAI1207537.1 hypothetical protein F4807DRAFT_181220 [Annulohypoxylon truncatum]